MFTETLARTLYCARERADDTSYHHEMGPRKRGTLPAFVIQRTITGEGYVTHEGQTDRAGPGYAMLLNFQDACTYGYPEDGTERYEWEYLTMIGGGMEHLFYKIRDEYGWVVNMPRDGRAYLLFADILQRNQQASFHDVWQSSTLIYELLCTLWRELANEQNDPVARALDYMANHFSRPISVEQVADYAGVSREHLSRIFNKSTGQSPARHLRTVRMERAREMLQSTDVPVEEIAMRCAYPDPSVFTRAYKNHWGHPPTAERD